MFNNINKLINKEIMANLFQKIECFLGLHKMETKIDKRKFSTVHYNEFNFCV